MRSGTVEKLPYPTNNSIPINPYELGFEAPKVIDYDVENHHNWYERRALSKLAITKVARDLEISQFALPIEEHKRLHAIYAPPRIHNLDRVYNYVEQAYEMGIQLREGSARRPVFKKFTRNIIEQVRREYKNL